MRSKLHKMLDVGYGRDGDARLDAGADFNGGYYVVLGPTYRFGQ
jgi:hypothetical protein